MSTTLSTSATTALDERLLTVASMVTGTTLADIGTDHARLPRYLLENGFVKKVIAVEKNPAPARLAKEALRGYPAEVRLGDGFDALQPGEVDCATLCGLGGWLISSVLSRSPERLPERLVLQANRDTPLIRVWAAQSGYHLDEERIAPGFWNFVVLSLRRNGGPDPAYDDLPRELAVEFGPHLIRGRHPLLCQEILERERYFRNTRATGVHRLLCQARDYLELQRL